MKTLVLGASTNPSRYSNIAINMLREYGHETVAIGLRPGKVNNVIIETNKLLFEKVHTITLYLNPERQSEYYDYILDLRPERIIFNPGTENPELAELAAEKGIEPMEACTLALLRSNQY